MNQNLGNGRILGGLRANLQPYELRGNAVTEQALNRFNDAVIDEINQYSRRPGQSITREQAEQLHWASWKMELLVQKVLRVSNLKKHMHLK